MLDLPAPSRRRLSQDARREQLIEAAIGAIAEHGLLSVTLEKVARRAGLTAGMVNFHFDSKQELLQATLERIASEYSATCEDAVRAAGPSPAAKLAALAAAPFHKDVARPDKLAVWYAFWGEIRTRDDYMEICGGTDQVYMDSARELIATLAETEGARVDPRAAAYGLCGTVDAVSMEVMLGRMDRGEASAIVLDYLRNLLPQSFADIRPEETQNAEAAPSPELDQEYLDRLTLPAWTYCDADFAARETERIHLTAWHIVCHVSELARDGDYVTMNVLGKRAVAIRGEDGAIRAFHNVCRHRAHEVLTGHSGNSGPVMRCPYHAWCYDKKGVLKGVAASRTFPQLDKNNLGLFPLDCEVFMGFVFVRFAGDGPSVAERYAPHAAELKHYRIEEMVPIADYWEGEVVGNWKNIWDNYLEDYHFPTGHPGLSALMGKDYDREPDYPSRTIRLSHALREASSGDWSTRMYSRLLPASEHLPEDLRRRWSYFFMYPGVAIETYPDLVDVFHITPVAPGRSLLRWRAYGLPDSSRAMAAARWLNQRINYRVHDEDSELVESVQRNLEAGVYERGVLSDKEVNVKALQDWVRADMPDAR